VALHVLHHRGSWPYSCTPGASVRTVLSRRRCSRVPAVYSVRTTHPALIAENDIVVIITIWFVCRRYHWWPAGNVRLNREGWCCLLKSRTQPRSDTVLHNASPERASLDANPSWKSSFSETNFSMGYSHYWGRVGMERELVIQIPLGSSCLDRLKYDAVQIDR
jgi:hypothetical protein